MTKMAAMPIYVKSVLNVLLQNQWTMALELSMYWAPKYYYYCSNDYDNFKHLLKTTGPTEPKFHIELPEGRKVCSNSPGHMTNMTVMPIHENSYYYFFHINFF